MSLPVKADWSNISRLKNSPLRPLSQSCASSTSFRSISRMLNTPILLPATYSHLTI